MPDFLKLFAIGVVLSLVIAAVLFAVRKVGLSGQRPVRRAEVLAYARKYLRKFPASTPANLREVLQQEYVPDRKIGRDRDHELAGCLFLGVFDVILASMVKSAAGQQEAEIKRVKELVAGVCDELFPQPDAEADA